MFSDVLGDRLGLFLDVLVGGHVIVLAYWVYSVIAEARKDSKLKKMS